MSPSEVGSGSGLTGFEWMLFASVSWLAPSRWESRTWRRIRWSLAGEGKKWSCFNGFASSVVPSLDPVMGPPSLGSESWLRCPGETRKERPRNWIIAGMLSSCLETMRGIEGPKEKAYC